MIIYGQAIYHYEMDKSTEYRDNIEHYYFLVITTYIIQKNINLSERNDIPSHVRCQYFDTSTKFPNGLN